MVPILKILIILCQVSYLRYRYLISAGILQVLIGYQVSVNSPEVKFGTTLIYVTRVDHLDTV